MKKIRCRRSKFKYESVASLRSYDPLTSCTPSKAEAQIALQIAHIVPTRPRAKPWALMIDLSVRMPPDSVVWALAYFGIIAYKRNYRQG